jgi:hypothetical protein
VKWYILLVLGWVFTAIIIGNSIAMAVIAPYRDAIVHFLAAPSDEDVTITFTPFMAPGPQMWGVRSLSAVLVTDTKVHLTWKNGDNITGTMIRAALGHYPQNTSDGWQVFYGSAQKAEDTGVNMDTMLDTVYYSAFGENVSGWYTDYAEAKVENPHVVELTALLTDVLPLAVGLGVLALFSVLSFWRPNVVNCLLPAGLASFVGFYAFDASHTALGIGIALTMLAFAIYNLGRAYSLLVTNRRDEDDD